jgi:hypothetical protein
MQFRRRFAFGLLEGPGFACHSFRECYLRNRRPIAAHRGKKIKEFPLQPFVGRLISYGSPRTLRIL